MKLYHRKFETDKDARTAHQAVVSAVEAAEGICYVAPSFGAGPAFHVVVLPDTVTPESLGITDAAFIVTLNDEEDDGELDQALDGVEDGGDE